MLSIGLKSAYSLFTVKRPTYKFFSNKEKVKSNISSHLFSIHQNPSCSRHPCAPSLAHSLGPKQTRSINAEREWRWSSTQCCSSPRRRHRACRRRFILSSSSTSAIAMSGVLTKPSALLARSSALSSLMAQSILETLTPFLITRARTRYSAFPGFFVFNFDINL